MEKNRELENTNRKLGALHVEFQHKNEELSKLVNDKNMLLGMAAHDLRNPLHAIQAYSEILEMKLPETSDESLLRMIKTIRRQSKFMLDLVNDLLNISVIDLGKLKLNLQQSNVANLVKTNCKLNESVADQKNISIHLTCDLSIPEMVIDPNKIEQVLNNLVNNAIKYSHPGSSIDIALKKDAEGVLLSVQDHGVGIPEGDTEHLFETITKKRSKGTSGEPSTGLGLAIAKRIVEEHKGKIWIKSKLGNGSTFYVYLPRIFKPEDFTIPVEHSSSAKKSTTK
jgi:two-component system sensor histidine kinase/response regulator